MALRVVGAGLGRTGTHSQKLALERLLGAPCYHMIETFGRPDDIPVWHRAVDGDLPDWRTFLADYAAAVDWPVCAFWRELSEVFPDAIVLLSTRDVDSWWTSASNTIFQVVGNEVAAEEITGAQQSMAIDMLAKRFTTHWMEEDEAKRAYEQHNADVRASIPDDRLVEWQPGDGWDPICEALGLPVPDEPYPHVNTTADFRAMTGMDG
ncbi:MAG: sulfotransferase family protein [Acidimicrobiia bacterium]